MKKIFFLNLTLLVIAQGLWSQSLVDVNPDEGEPGTYMELTITGNNTMFTQGSNSVWLTQGSNLINSNYTWPENDTELMANFYFSYYDDPGLYDLSVYNTETGIMELEDAFDIIDNSPHITDIAPDHGHQRDTLNLTISGTNTHFEQASGTAVWFMQGSSSIPLEEVNAIDNENLEVTNHVISYMHPTGNYDIHAYNNIDGFMMLENAFTVYLDSTPPVIKAVQPNAIGQNDSLSLKISGTHTSFTQATSTTLIFTQGMEAIEVNDAQAISADTLLLDYNPFTIDQPAGFYDLYVFNNIDGVMTLNNAVNILALPMLMNVTPTQIYQQEPTNITINAINTHFTQAGATQVAFVHQSDSMQIENIEVIDSTTLRIPDFVFNEQTTATGIYDIYVHNNIDSTLKLASAFSLDPPANGINQENNVNISIYPNPAKSILTVELPSPSVTYHVSIIDMSGKKMMSQRQKGGNALVIDLKDMHPGTYLLNIFNGNKPMNKVIVINE